MSPIECEQVLQQIELYLDGELVGAARIEIERHLGGCDPCSGHSEFQQRLKEVLRVKCGCRDVPSDLVERIRILMAAQHPQQPEV